MPDERCVLNPSQPCIGSAKAALLEKRVTDLERWKEDSKTFHEKFYDWQREQIARDAALDEKLSTMGTNIDKLVSWKEEEKAKPGKRWESIADKVLMLFVGAVVTFLLTQIGL